jgi:hypothetical protein
MAGWGTPRLPNAHAALQMFCRQATGQAGGSNPRGWGRAQAEEEAHNITRRGQGCLVCRAVEAAAEHLSHYSSCTTHRNADVHDNPEEIELQHCSNSNWVQHCHGANWVLGLAVCKLQACGSVGVPYLWQHLSHHLCSTVTNGLHHLLMLVTLQDTQHSRQQRVAVSVCCSHSCCHHHAEAAEVWLAATSFRRRHT